ncbi:hypothetical protein C8Q72DRAFT_212480 [Fomitopsis betulina]|nr:hypothetical protein C8Q72DRAFT_212480 [Fomitopsis betulina]
MRYSTLAVVALSAAALPAMSRPVSAREYDDLMAREPSTEELDRRFIIGGLLHIAKEVGSGIAHLVQNRKNKKKKRDVEDTELFERELGDEELYARELYDEDLFERELPEEFLFERELPEDGLYEREFYEYEWN